MPRTWFRHEATMRFDPGVETLAKEFGPIGEAVWHRLLEVRCQTDGDIVATLHGLRANLGIPPEWELDLEGWLRRAAQLRLIKLGRRRNDVRTIALRAWTKYQPAIDSPQYERERKRRQRGQMSRGTPPGHYRDTTGTSRPTNERTKRDPTGQDETRQNEGGLTSARRAKLRVESVSSEQSGSDEANGNGRVAHEDQNPDSYPEPRTPREAEAVDLLVSNGQSRHGALATLAALGAEGVFARVGSTS